MRSRSVCLYFLLGGVGAACAHSAGCCQTGGVYGSNTMDSHKYSSASDHSPSSRYATFIL